MSGHKSDIAQVQYQRTKATAFLQLTCILSYSAIASGVKIGKVHAQQDRE